MSNAGIDQNGKQTLTALSSANDGAIVQLWADPTTHRLLTDFASASGTVTSVSIVTANGFAGTVATATTTPAITLTTSINSPVLAGNGTAIAAATTTGTGSTVVLQGTPTLTTPVLGVAAATSINKVTITAPASSATLTIADGKVVTHNATTTFAGTDGKTLTISKTLALDGTDSTTMTFPATSATIARTDALQTFTGVQTFSSTIVGSINGNAATVTTNANLTGPVTSVGNATTVGLTAFSSLNGPQGFLINGKLSITVASNNITVALKTIAGGDPSASDPVYCRIGDTVRTVTAALSVTKNAGTNYFSSGSTNLAALEIDYFAYLGYNATDGVVIGFARIPYAKQYSDFSVTSTNQKYCAISTITTAASTDYYQVVGRFAATLSATASFNWSVPAFTAINLIQYPIFTTRKLSFLPAITWTNQPTSSTITGVYTVNNTNMIMWVYLVGTANGANAGTTVQSSVPMDYIGLGKSDTFKEILFQSGMWSDNATFDEGTILSTAAGTASELLSYVFSTATRKPTIFTCCAQYILN